MNLQTLIRCWALALGFAWSLASLAQSPESQFDAGRSAYDLGDFAGAQRAYESLLEAGYESAALYHNLGNAHYRQQHVGPAILAYEKALKLDPSLEDARYNLALARRRVVDALKPLPELFFTAWLRRFVQGRPSELWAWLSVLMTWLALGGGAAYLFLEQSSLRKVGFWGGLAALAFGLLFTGFAFSRRSQERNPGTAIILAPNAYVKNAPAGPTDLLILHEGAKVQWLGESSGWVKIRIEDARSGPLVGFVQAGELDKI
jgi:tetratricopeptide (TPR) repeat protein